MEPSKSDYQPIDDKPETEKLIDTSSTSTASSESTTTNPTVATKRNAPSYEQAASLPTAETNTQAYSSYQNAPPPPAYQNLPDYNASVPNTNYSPVRIKKFQDTGFTIFFLAWFIPANFVFARIIAAVDFSIWWANPVVPYWGFISAAFVGVILSQIWIFLTLNRVFGTAINERRATITILTISALSMSYVGRVGTVYSWIFLIWIACIIRILWDASITSSEDHYLSASIIQLVKPQLNALLVPFIILQFFTFFFILYWGFNYSLLSAIALDFPAAHAFLFLALIWYMMVIRAIVMSTVSSMIASWYNNSGSLNISTYGMTALTNSMIHGFGSMVFASIFVDAFGVCTWFLIRIHALLYGKKVKKSVLTRVASKIEKVVNSSSYTVIVPEQQEFVEASQRAHAYLKAASPAMRSTTMKYHNFFMGLQAFALTLGGTANPVAATASGMYVFAFTSIFHAACIALTTSYGRDPTFLTTVDNALAVQFQQKLSHGEKEEI